MRDQPILFGTPMVLALLADRLARIRELLKI